MIILTQQLKQHSKMIFGAKQEKIAFYKELLKQGAENGIDNKAIVVDTSFLGEVNNIKNLGNVGAKVVVGFVKCHWDQEELVESYAQDQLVAKLPKIMGKLVGNTVNIHSIVSCYLEANNDAWISEAGQEGFNA